MSRAAKCLIDDRRVPDGARLCRGCTDKLSRDLEAVPDLVADLLITVSRQDHVQAAQPGRSAGTPLVFNPGASEELADLRYYLATWTGRMAAHLGVELDIEDQPVAYAAWLGRFLRVIRHHDDAAQLSTEIHRAVAAARHAVDLAPVSSRFPVGPCPRIIEGGWFCDGDVLATITTVADEPPTMTCLRCEHVWRAEQWLRAGKQIKNRSDETGWRPRPRSRADTDI